VNVYCDLKESSATLTLWFVVECGMQYEKVPVGLRCIAVGYGMISGALDGVDGDSELASFLEGADVHRPLEGRSDADKTL